MKRAAWLRVGLVAAGASFALWSATAAQQPPAGPAPAAARNSVNGATARTEGGFGIFQQRCLSCHGKAEYERAPTPAALRDMSPEHIYEVLTTGIMSTVIGNQLSDAERKSVAESISGRLMGTAASGDAAKMPNRCASNPPLADPTAGPAWNGWGVDHDNSRFQTAKAAGLTPATVPKLKLKWAFGFPDGSSAFGQPSIVSGRVFVGADTGYIYSLDAKTGCVYWSFQTKAGVRNAMTIAPVKGHAGVKYAVFFGDVKANVYAVDAQTGRQLWTNHVEDHITDRVTGAPSFYDGKLFVPISSWEEFRAADPTYGCCTSQGAVAGLDANTGKTLWKTYVTPTRPAPTRKNTGGVQQYGPAGGSVWNTPTIDPKRGLIYFGTGDATTFPAITTSDAVMAVDMNTGAVKWSYQVHKNDSFLGGCAQGPNRSDNCPQVQGPDWDIPSSPILRHLGGKDELIVSTKPGDILAIDVDHPAQPLWRMNVSGPTLAGDGPAPAGVRFSGNTWGGAAEADTAYYGLTGGGVAAIDLTKGQRKWFVPLNGTPNAPPPTPGTPPTPRVSHGSATTAIPGVAFVGGNDGKLFAVSTKDGSTLWSFETAKVFDTVNKVPAKGGSITAPGATVAGGMVFIGSGYSTTGGEPGNVLLAFQPQ